MSCRVGFYIVHNSQYKCVLVKDLPFELNDGKPNLFKPNDDLSEFYPELKFPNVPFKIRIKANKVIYPFYRDKELTMVFEGGFNGNEEYIINEIIKNDNLIIGKIENFWDVIDHSYYDAYVNLNESYIEIIKDENETSQPDEKPTLPSKQEIFSQKFEKYFYSTLIKDKDFLNYFNTERTYTIIAEEDEENIMGLITFHKGSTDLILNQFDYRTIIMNKFPNIKEALVLKDETFGGYDPDKDFNIEPIPEPVDVNYIVTQKEGVTILEVREGPDDDYPITSTIAEKGRFTIVVEYNGYGKLKSGAGWIKLAYVEKPID